MSSIRSVWRSLALCLLVGCGGRSEDDAESGGTSGMPGTLGAAGTSGTPGAPGGGAGASGTTSGSAGSNGTGAGAAGTAGDRAASGGLGGASELGGRSGGSATGGAGMGGRGGASEVAGASPSGGIAGNSGGAAGASGTAVAAAGAPQCNDRPVCDHDDPALPPDGACAPGPCYTRTLCGYEIICSRMCKWSDDRNQHYVEFGECALAEIECPDNTVRFNDDCGCGCEQDPSCPAVINCLQPEPGDCTPEVEAKCPYSSYVI